MGICVRTAKLCLYNFNVQLHRACLKENLCTFSLVTTIGLKHSVLTAKCACARASMWLQMSFSIRALQSRQGTHRLNGSGTAPRVHSGNCTESHCGLLWRKNAKSSSKNHTTPPHISQWSNSSPIHGTAFILLTYQCGWLRMIHMVVPWHVQVYHCQR